MEWSGRWGRHIKPVQGQQLAPWLGFGHIRCIELPLACCETAMTKSFEGPRETQRGGDKSPPSTLFIYIFIFCGGEHVSAL